MLFHVNFTESFLLKNEIRYAFERVGCQVISVLSDHTANCFRRFHNCVPRLESNFEQYEY